jgi:deoxyribose-phosphate aldolase
VTDSGQERAALAAKIDHTLLDAGATASDVDRLCDEAVACAFAAVCVNSVWVARCAARLRGTKIGVVSVAGFPLGASLTEIKALEARRAVEAGASEVDVVVFLGGVKGRQFEEVRADLEAVVRAAAPGTIKAILETGRLTRDETALVARLAVEAGAAFVKTSTGFGSGATVDEVRWLRQIVGPEIGVKASGGIRTLEQALALIEAGATRLGTSSGVAIVRGAGSAA